MNVFLIHGSYGKPYENWFPWLDKELTERNISFTAPSFPTPEHQYYPDWERLLRYYVDMGLINENTILIGHSTGAICATTFIIKNSIRVKSLITVAGYNNYIGGDDYIDGLNQSFYVEDSELKKVKDLTGKRFCFASTNDPFITISALHSFADNVNGTLIELTNAGHFNESAGYTVFPEILELITTIANEQ